MLHDTTKYNAAYVHMKRYGPPGITLTCTPDITNNQRSFRLTFDMVTMVYLSGSQRLLLSFPTEEKMRRYIHLAEGIKEAMALTNAHREENNMVYDEQTSVLLGRAVQLYDEFTFEFDHNVIPNDIRTAMVPSRELFVQNEQVFRNAH